jgi:hypothetical protein
MTKKMSVNEQKLKSINLRIRKHGTKTGSTLSCSQNAAHYYSQDALRRLASSMTLDEMLEASSAINIEIKGERSHRNKTNKVKAYVGTTVGLYKNPHTKLAAKKMQQNLNAQIVKKNKATVDTNESKRLYQAIMKEN